MYQKENGRTVSGYWGRLIFICVMLFFVFLGDAIYSDWTPAFVQSSVKSPLVMGLVMSFSSLIGLLADLIFPQLLKKMSSTLMILMAIATSIFFGVLMYFSISWPTILFFLTGMAVWGVYYEFLGFGASEYVSANISSHLRTGAWSMMSAFRGLAYFLGPIIGSLVSISYGDRHAVGLALTFTTVGFLIWLVAKRIEKKERVIEVEQERINIFLEIKHWGLLLKSVWPVVIISLTLGLLDATFWTTGTVYSDNLARIHIYGSLFLPLYELPMVVVGLVVAKLGIYKGKKKLAELFMLISGILMMFMSLTNSIVFLLFLSLMVGVVTAICWPLKDAIYTDVTSRMGHEGKHMIGLSGSTVSVAYIFGPIISGVVAQSFGDKNTFVIVGMFVSLVSLLLLIFTPKKMRLPQGEISEWN